MTDELTMSWYRNVVPNGYALATLELDSRSPLLMKSSEFDPDGELYRSFYMLGQKRQKTLDDGRRLRELEWQLGLYLDEEIGPYIPAKNVKELLRESATKWRKGEEIKRSLIVIEHRLPLQYEGPRDQAGLQEKKFYYDTMVANAGRNAGRVFRRRPEFKVWKLTAELAYDPEDLDFDFLQLVVERSRKYGLGDGRAIGFGAFDAVLTAGATFKGEANGSAVKPRDTNSRRAHQAARERVMTTAK
jgi:hypothetical protein